MRWEYPLQTAATALSPPETIGRAATHMTESNTTSQPSIETERRRPSPPEITGGSQKRKNTPNLVSWTTAPPKSGRRNATQHEAERGAHTLKQLTNYGLKKFRALKTQVEVGPIFAIVNATPNEFLAVDGVGEKIKHRFPDINDVELYHPEDWEIEVVGASCCLIHHHLHSDTRVVAARTASGGYTVVVYPDDYPSGSGLLLTKPEGYKAPASFAIVDVVLTATERESPGYIHSRDAAQLQDSLEFKTPCP